MRGQPRGDTCSQRRLNPVIIHYVTRDSSSFHAFRRVRRQSNWTKAPWQLSHDRGGYAAPTDAAGPLGAQCLRTGPRQAADKLALDGDIVTALVGCDYRWSAGAGGRRGRPATPTYRLWPDSTTAHRRLPRSERGSQTRGGCRLI